MNEKDQKKAIAEFCGYSGFHEEEYSFGTFGRGTRLRAENYPKSAPSEMHPYSTVPDYLYDLNAMFDAETVLSRVSRSKFKIYTDSLPVRPNAKTRARKFLKAIGKWSNKREPKKEWYEHA